MATVVREIERKFEATDSAAVLQTIKDMTGHAGVAAVEQRGGHVLDAVYYDTADLRLIRHGITLRRRTGGADAGWHLKLPAGEDTRDEIRLPLDEPTGRTSTRPARQAAATPPARAGGARTGGAPKALAGLVRAYTRGSALVPVVYMRTSRRVLAALDGAGQTLAEVAIDQVTAEQAGGSPATSWEEIEIELVGGGRDLLTEAAARMRAAGARPAATASKLERALGGRLAAAPAGAARARTPRLSRRSPAGDVVLAYLRRQADAIMWYDPLVRRDAPDAVHQMRVATRRARSALQAFGKIIDIARTRPLCDELKWLATVLGQARDAEVMLARFTGDLAGIPPDLVAGPVKDRIAGHFAAETARARAGSLRALDGQRYLRLLDGFDALIADPPLTPLAARRAGKALTKPVRRARRRLERALAAVPGAANGTADITAGATAHGGAGKDTAIHEARKAAKRARYAAEAAIPALGGTARRQAARTKSLQSLLGDHHDSVVARELLRAIARQAREAGEDTFTYGLMYGRQACQAAAMERALAAATAGGRHQKPG